MLITGETEAEIIRQNGGSVPISPTMGNTSSPGMQVNRPVSPITAGNTLTTALTGKLQEANLKPIKGR